MQELVLIANDAYVLADMDDGTLAQQLPQTGRVPPDALTMLRNTCLALLSAAMQWDEFRWAARPCSTPLFTGRCFPSICVSFMLCQTWGRHMSSLCTAEDGALRVLVGGSKAWWLGASVLCWLRVQGVRGAGRAA